MAQELDKHYEVLGEAVQTVMRKYKVPLAYEILKYATRGKGALLKEDCLEIIEEIEK